MPQLKLDVTNQKAPIEEAGDTNYDQAQQAEKPVQKVKIPSKDIQDKIILEVKQTQKSYQDLLKAYHERLIEVYEAYSTYKQKKYADWATTFKVNKAHEIVEKVLPRIVAKNPKWIVSPRIDDFFPNQPFIDEAGQELTDPHTIPDVPETLELRRQAWTKWIEARNKRYEQMQEFCRGIQDYLTYIFDEYGYSKFLRMWAKNMISYGKGLAKIKYKYEIAKLEVKPDGSEEEDVSGEYPTIDVKSWTDILWDPRYLYMRDMPAVIEITDGVRFWDLKTNQSNDYFNLDKLENLLSVKLEDFQGDMLSYKKKIESIAGISDTGITTPVERNSLTLATYYGWFSEDDKKAEKMYEICIVAQGANLLFPISYKQITAIPFEDIDCFEDLELNQPVGFIEPIISLQDELNFKKNSGSTYINNALNRMWLWSPQSGVDPRDLVSRPNGIITTTKSVQEAKANLEQMHQETIDPAFFNEQNDFERQIQSASFTVDTSNQRNQQALTNTATGIRVAFFESNSVIDEVRKHFEEGMSRLAYKLLQCTFEHMEENIVIKKMGQEGWWEINKELLKNAIMRYSIKVEVNSSAFDYLDDKREDAIGFWNVSKNAKDAGVNVNLEECYRDICETFEKHDPGKYIMPKSIAQVVAEMLGENPAAAAGGGGGGQIPNPAGGYPGAADLTTQVAGGDLTSAIQQ